MHLVERKITYLGTVAKANKPSGAFKFVSSDTILITIQASLYNRYLTTRYASRYRPHYTIDISRYDTHHDTGLTIRYISHDTIRITIQASLYDRYLTIRITIQVSLYDRYITIRITIQVSLYDRYLTMRITIQVSLYDRYLTIRITIQASLYDRYLTIRHAPRYRPHFTIDISPHDTHHDTGLIITQCSI